MSLTTFADFVTASGTSRITKVRAAKKSYEAGYAPERDFYKGFRERLQDNVARGWDAAALQQSLSTVPDAKKAPHYKTCLDGFSKWAGKKTIAALPVVRGHWSSGGLDISVNPELHVTLNGSPVLIKLYLKGDPSLSKQKADLILHLIALYAPAGTSVGILDVRRSKLFVPTVAIPALDAFLNAEALAMASLWSHL